MQEAFGLIWLGINDEEEVLKATKDKAKIAENIAQRRKTLINHLYQMQRVYNLDKTGRDIGGDDNKACTSGAFSILINTLAGAHECVTFTYVTSEYVLLKAGLALESAIKQLTNQEKEDYAREPSKDGDLPTTLSDKIKSHILGALEEEFQDCKHTLPSYEGIVHGFIENLNYHAKYVELSQGLSELREIQLIEPRPSYLPSAAGNEPQRNSSESQNASTQQASNEPDKVEEKRSPSFR